ncbi:MAG: DUF4132 domain-containing protein [Planctomycetota bacterium]
MTEQETRTPSKSELVRWLEETGKTVKLPAWLEVSLLPRLIWNDGEPVEEVRLVAACLRKQATDEEASELTLVRDSLDREAAARFAWEIFRQWDSLGGPAAHKWAVYSLGAFGNDDTARRLGRLVRDWPGQRKYRRAEQGLHALERIGSDAALAEIDGVRNTSKSVPLRDLASATLKRVAATRHMTLDDLSDRLVPTCGLDPRGRMNLDFGARAFTASLRPDLTLTLFDADGKPRANLPKPAKGDDPNQATAATELFKNAKKQLKEILAQQTIRLERAMVDERSWPVNVWKTTFLDHPVLRMLSPRILWTLHPADDLQLRLFRIAEDWSLANAEDRSVEWLRDAAVKIFHPLNPCLESLDAWKTVFRDYEIVPLFDQLERETFEVREVERLLPALERYVGHMVDGRQVLAQLARQGWITGTPREFGSVFVHSRSYRGADVTAILYHGGVLLGYYQEAIESAIGPLAFVKGEHGRVPADGFSPKDWLPLGSIEKVAFSEAVRDVDRLARAGKGFDPDWKRKMGLG